MTIQEILKTTQATPVILAPMAGVTDLAFRELCMDSGSDFTYSEMVSAKAVSFNNKKTFALMEVSDIAKPYGIQLFGHEPHIMGETAQRLCAQYGNDMALIDINMGCPAPKIVNNGDGSALMKDMLLASKVIEYVAKRSTVPVTVKFRKGWSSSAVNAVEFAKMAEKSGAAAITIHGRTREQMYGGKADWDIIGEIKAAVRIPVIGNGDIVDYSTAMSMLKQTHCDAVMIGRAAQGNPFIFREIKSCMNGTAYEPPTWEERIETAIDHMHRHRAYKGDAAFPEMRKHLAWYVKGMPHAAVLRTQVFNAKSSYEAEKLLRDELLVQNRR